MWCFNTIWNWKLYIRKPHILLQNRAIQYTRFVFPKQTMTYSHPDILFKLLLIIDADEQKMKFQKPFSRILSCSMYCGHKMCKPKRSALAVLPGNKSPEVFWENINQLLATVFGYVPNTLLISLLTKWTIYFAARILLISYFILIGLADGFPFVVIFIKDISTILVYIYRRWSLKRL